VPDLNRAAPVTQTAQPRPSEALCRLRQHEISLNEYLDICVEKALSHLVGNASPDRLQFIRALLREQLMTDPVLIEYVRQATGSDPQGASGS